MASSRPFPAVGLVFRLGNFGHETFQFDIEPVDNRLPLRLVASDVDRLRGNVAARAFILFCFDEADGVSNQTQPATIGCVLTVMSRNIHWLSPKTTCAGGISGRLAGSNEREPNQLRAHRSSHDRTEKAK